MSEQETLQMWGVQVFNHHLDNWTAPLSVGHTEEKAISRWKSIASIDQTKWLENCRMGVTRTVRVTVTAPTGEDG